MDLFGHSLLLGGRTLRDTEVFNLPVVSIDADFAGILDNFDFAAMAIVDARNGPYCIFGDLTLVDIAGGPKVNELKPQIERGKYPGIAKTTLHGVNQWDY